MVDAPVAGPWYRRLGVVLAIATLVATGCASGAEPSARRPATSTTPPTTMPPTTTTVPPPPTTTAPPVPQFQGVVAAIEGPVRARIEGSSWRPGCPVPLEQLRYLTLSHWGFDGVPHTGELVVHADEADAMVAVFRRLFEERVPIRSLRLVDDFGADDTASGEADNTSAFNCRPVTGGTRWSQHAYGRAIDVNPVENPYVVGATFVPSTSGPYLDRSVVRPGMAVAGGPLNAAFASVGWGWGGTWSSPVDYQHFSRTGH